MWGTLPTQVRRVAAAAVRPQPAAVAPGLRDYCAAHSSRASYDAGSAAGPESLGTDGVAGAELGALLEILVCSTGTRRAVAAAALADPTLRLARALPADGYLISVPAPAGATSSAGGTGGAAGPTAPISAEAAARIRAQLDIRPGAPAETIAALPDRPELDLAFLDTDPSGYQRLYDLLLPRLRPDGLLVVGGVLARGNVLTVVGGGGARPDVEVLRVFNDSLVLDDRVQVVMLPVGDGVSVVRKLSR